MARRDSLASIWRPSVWLIPVVAALCAVLTVIWGVANRPVTAEPELPAGKLQSVSFAPFRTGQSPLTGTFPTATQVEADIELLAPYVASLRTYAAIDGDYDVAAIAQKHGLKLWQGIWLGSNRAQNAREIARGIEMANRYPDTVTRMIVGNEVLLRRDLPPEELIDAIEQVRRAVRQPVTTADVWEFWLQFPQLADHVDVITIHLLPYWEDTPRGLPDAVGRVLGAYVRIAGAFPAKKVVIGETGWPSRGRRRADAVPSLVDQTEFLRGVVSWVTREGIEYNLIEAFDQVWKYRNEGGVGANWGLWTADRRLKFTPAGPVVEHPQWRRDALVGCALGIVLLAVGMIGRRLRVGGQIRLAVLAMVLGGALGWAMTSTLPDIYDAYSFVAAAANLAGQALLAWLLMRRAGGRLAGQRVAALRCGSDSTEAIRLLFYLKIPPAWPASLFSDLSFLFAWSACVLQLLLVFDPRYRDFPTPAFIVPVIAVLARALIRDLPIGGGRHEEVWLGTTLSMAALIGGYQEGDANLQAQLWTVCALILAIPPLLSLGRRIARI